MENKLEQILSLLDKSQELVLEAKSLIVEVMSEPAPEGSDTPTPEGEEGTGEGEGEDE